ncbi:putative tricarboxylic transport membrane protein [Devosia enhydra]|uniref:Putative tricarboxylic transport membrane protein n=1 Tax=Devosia enhydra TaxID=665118 RepID=A0A1K2I0X8_9HYPH|nr:tripartite tricarboxylate transporter permease [Devosia enhydra]SFZ86030.1 putative tricarboxylic transport membrane protein [Devosia enhydra]
MDSTFGLWVQGISAALEPSNLLFAFVGCIIGTLVGVLPGLGPAAAMAILIPFTYDLGPVPAIVMLSAIYFGTQYGGTITSVLVNVPGESTSVVTCLDGHPMAKSGRAGAALGIAAIGSLFAGLVGTFLLMVLALPLSSLALRFGPVEMFALLVVGLSLVMSFRGGSLLAAFAMTMIGLMLGLVGLDPVQGAPRFTFGNHNLFDGVQLVPVIMGLFGISELLASLEERSPQPITRKITSLLPFKEERKDAALAITRGTGVGFALGIIPGMAGIVPTFMAYALEKRVSKHPERFGHGAIEGVASAEASNNAHAQASMVPLLTLGIPGTATLAVMMGAFMINGITPGPFLFVDHPEIVWTVIGSFIVGNVVLFILNFPLVHVWVQILRIPSRYLHVAILIFCLLGAFTLRNNTFDVMVMIAFGVLGYIFKKLDWPTVPLVIAIILGPLLERALRQSLELSDGDASVFVTTPVSAGLLGLAFLVVAVSVLSGLRPVKRLSSRFSNPAGKADQKP